MTKYCFLSILLFLSVQISFSQITENIADSNDGKKPKMQVVFALDATGSMGGLISAAKDKIWSIVSSLAQTQTAPDIEVGLIFYRDKGDEFITKRIALTDSMDVVYSELMQVSAKGGGDGPESVNQGLNEAVELFNWDTDTSTYKAIFLVGDYEPHMDYKNDVPYFVTCKIAKRKDIVLNTILMGNNKTAGKIWKEIANCNEGAFVNVNMNVNDIDIATPYDSAIASINDQLDDLRYYYGKTSVKEKSNLYKAKSKQMAFRSKINVKAQRAEYNFNYHKKESSKKQHELISDLASNNVLLDSIAKDQLPDEFKDMSTDSIAFFIKQKTALRDSLQQLLKGEVEKRNAYIETELAKKSKVEVEGSFNNIIFTNIQKQTKKKNIQLKGKAKY